MQEGSYEFDPCTLDGSDIDDDEPVKMDDWKPSANKPKIVASKWRQEQIGTDFNQQPGLDELRKIHMYLKKKASDADIMHAFGITADTLIAIKKNRYDPIDGIALDNLSKIYKEFDRLENKIDSLMRGINHIGKIMFIDKEELANFKKSFKKPKKTKPGKRAKAEVVSQSDEIIELTDDFFSEEE